MRLSLPSAVLLATSVLVSAIPYPEVTDNFHDLEDSISFHNTTELRSALKARTIGDPDVLTLYLFSNKGFGGQRSDTFTTNVPDIKTAACTPIVDAYKGGSFMMDPGLMCRFFRSKDCSDKKRTHFTAWHADTYQANPLLLHFGLSAYKCRATESQTGFMDQDFQNYDKFNKGD